MKLLTLESLCVSSESLSGISVCHNPPSEEKKKKKKKKKKHLTLESSRINAER